MSAQLTNSIQLLVSNVTNAAQQQSSSNSYNNFDSDPDVFSAALDNAAKSYADKSENKVTSQKNDYAKDTKNTKDTHSAKTQEVKEDTATPQTGTENNKVKDSSQTDKSQTDKIKQEVTSQEESKEESLPETPSDEMSVQTMQPVNEQSAIMPAIDTNVQKNAIANEQILANIDCPQENNTTSQKPETVKPLQAAQNVQIVETQVQTDDVPQIDTQTLKNIQNTAENATGQISTAIDESQTTTTATDSAIKESKFDNVQTAPTKTAVQDLASDMSKVTANVEVEQTEQPEIKVLTPSDTKIEKTPEIKVTQEVAASIEENVNTVANNIENKDTTSKIKDKAVAQMTAMEDKNTVVTQTTVQQESSSNQQNNNNLTQNNAQEQVVKMSMESNTGSSNVQINGLETFVSKMDAQLSAASNASSSMQNTLNTNSIMEQVNKQFEQLQQSTANKVSIVLQPENLGRVSVEIMNTKDGITAKMMTDSQQVKDLFDKNIEALKSNLSAQGVNVNNIKVECAQESSNNAMNFEREQFNQSFNNPNSSNHNQTNQSNSQTVYTNTDNLNFDDAETDINSGVEIKNIQTMIKHNGKVDYKV